MMEIRCVGESVGLSTEETSAMTAILGSDQRYQRLLVECARRFGRWQNLLGSRRSHDARAPSLKAELEFQRAQQALERRRMQLSDLARGEG